MAKGGDTIMLLGAAAVAYYGYTQGWFSGILGKLGAGAAAPAPLAGGGAAAPKVAPPLGTTVTTLADALAQAAANDAYIIPDPATFSSLQSSLPSGYNWIVTTDRGNVLLRGDVYTAVQKDISNRVQRATSQGASTASIQAASNETLGQVQSAMSIAGLSGLGDFQRYIVTRTGRIRPVRVA